MITATTKETIKKAKQELKKIFDYIDENRDALTGYTDLKLHDVSFYCYREMATDFPLCYAADDQNSEYNYFYTFCEFSFDDFNEYLRDNGIDFYKTVDYIGRTSKFYCYAGHDNDAETMINDFICNDYIFEIENGHFSFFNGFNETIADLKFFAENALKDFKAKTADAIKIYEYIKDFKQNQIDYFKEFLTYYEEDLQAENDAETAKINADAETARGIAAAFKIPDDTMLTLKSCIYAY